MAEFSKQYCEKYDPQMPWDFDTDAEFDKIICGEWTTLICEGYGFTGIQKLLDGTKQVVFVNYSTGQFKNFDYDKLTDTTYRDIWRNESAATGDFW